MGRFFDLVVEKGDYKCKGCGRDLRGGSPLFGTNCATYCGRGKYGSRCNPMSDKDRKRGRR